MAFSPFYLLLKYKKLILTKLLVVSLFVVCAQDKTFTTNLPIVYFNTEGKEIVDDPRIIIQMEIAWKGEGETNSTSDPRTHFNGKINIEIRGSSSQMFPKKSFGFELKDEEEQDMDFPLLGLPEEEDWILYAPYSDKALIRNVLTFTLASQFSNIYSSRCRFVELFINEKYEGIYVLMEKIKRDKNRVDIAKLKTEDIEGEELTGGYIVKIDKTTGSGGDGWHSEYKNDNGNRTFYQYDYPKSEDIQPEQKQYIENYIEDFETAVHFQNHDTVTGYMSYINSESFFDMIIMNEISRNVDGYRLSTYLYKDKNEKLTAGPLWDYNLSFGNANYYNGWETNGLQVFEDLGGDHWGNPFWWLIMMTDAHFTNPFNCRWETLRENQLSDERIFAVTDSLISFIGEAATRNFERWPILGEYIWPNYFVGNTYVSEVNWMKNWMTDRLANLDFIMPGKCGEDPDKPPVEFDYKIYPSPFSTKITIEIQSEYYSTYHFRLYTLNGQMVKDVQLKVVEGTNSYDINTSSLRSGMFIYRLIKGEKDVSVGKMVKI